MITTVAMASTIASIQGQDYIVPRFLDLKIILAGVSILYKPSFTMIPTVALVSTITMGFRAKTTLS